MEDLYNCIICSGLGYTVEPDPKSNIADPEPMQVECEFCHGCGRITAKQLHTWLTDQLGLGWISVDERLPECKYSGGYSGHLSVQWKYIDYPALYINHDVRYIKDKGFIHEIKDGKYIFYQDAGMEVIRWFEIPQPPEDK